ncbi:T-complex protein 11 [Xylariales sp. AK1849]|nr:T-complex protein 11 [Xylariales sp. AK1849]
MDDQGTSGLESSGRGPRRLSEAATKTCEDEIQQQSVQAKAPSPETEEQATYPQNFSPRNKIFTPVPTPGATNGGLSRNPSTGSNSSEDWTERSQRRGSDRGRRQFRTQSSPAGSAPQPSRPLEPPVTKATLSELDVNKIIQNPKLRHDINFDPELHFRPNLDGEKGRRKTDKANQFWTTLSEQLQQFVVQPLEFQQRYGQGQDWCLPLLLRSVKEIIQTLVPARDRVYLDEGLNVDLIMQQFNRGMADLEKLASWLSGVLKSHCAPMRDEWVDEMYNQLTNGNRTNNMEELVQGMRSLLSVLEAMKLDVANHQIRLLRPILIEDTVHFEKRFFYKKIQGGKLEPHSAQQWYHMATHECQPSHASRAAFGDMSIFFEAVSRLILPSNLDPLPNTFLFDEERMVKLRTDMLDAINLDICMRLYERLEKDHRQHNPHVIATPFVATPFSDSFAFLTAGSDDESEFNFNNVTSRPASLVFSSAGSANSSPRSSMVLPSIPTSSPADARIKSRNLYNSLVALLQTTPASSRPTHKWKAMKDSLALQIFRYTDAPQEFLLQFEDELDQHLSKPDSPLFQDVEQHFHTRLIVELQQRVKELKPLTGVGLFSVATGGRLHGPGRTWDGRKERSLERDTLESSQRETRQEGGIEDMAVRLAHIGILHWRVWSQLVYHADLQDTEMSI